MDTPANTNFLQHIRPNWQNKIPNLSKKCVSDSIKKIREKLGDSITSIQQAPPKPGSVDSKQVFTMDEDEEPHLNLEETPVDGTGRLLYEQPFTDTIF